MSITFKLELNLVTEGTGDPSAIDQTNDQIEILEDFFFSSEFEGDEKEEQTRPAFVGWMKMLFSVYLTLDEATQAEKKLKEFVTINCPNLIIED